jgi:gamma-tubulin complex component 5
MKNSELPNLWTMRFSYMMNSTLFYSVLLILANYVVSSINRILSQCFLDVSTSNLRKAILSILDMCLHFSNFFVAFVGETTATHDVSRQTISMRRHRSRRLKRQRRNIIGFTQFLREQADSSSSSDDGEEFELNEPKKVPEASFSTSISITDINPIEYLDKLSKELDELVRFVRRGVESLANAGGEASSTFGIFAFALEDWDL